MIFATSVSGEKINQKCSCGLAQLYNDKVTFFRVRFLPLGDSIEQLAASHAANEQRRVKLGKKTLDWTIDTYYSSTMNSHLSFEKTSKTRTILSDFRAALCCRKASWRASLVFRTF